MSASDRVVANSKFSRGVVRQVFGSDKLGDVEVVYPCVDTDVKSQPSVTTSADALWGGRKILLSINRFERKKDMALAIRAYHGLGEEKRQGTRLVIAGEYSNIESQMVYFVLMECFRRRLRQSCPRKRPISS